MGERLIIHDVDKWYPGKKPREAVLENLNLTVDSGEIVGITGPSGCGKTTLLHLIAGFDCQYAGSIRYGDREISGPSPRRGVVFQSPRLFPWLTVRDNISFGLKLEGRTSGEIRQETDRFLKETGLSGYGEHYPHQLSGGMSQRAALARALIMRPGLLLMDEPFSSLDELTRWDMIRLTLDLWKEYRPSIVFVTHNTEEALLMADRVLVMSPRPGRITGELPVPLPRPRIPELLAHQGFAELKTTLFRLLEKGRPEVE